MNGASPTGLPPLRVKGRTLLPIVQGGMGVGISAHRLAGTVARLGAVGTIASVDLRRHHPDLMAATGSGRDKNAIERANLVALDREACGLRDGVAKMGQFCIDLHLGFALEGDRQRGLFFRGAGALPFGSEIRPARELVEYLLGAPAGTVTSARLPRVASA